MRNRTVGINVRVTPSEKELLQKAAKLCGLSLSDYLRKLGLGREIAAEQREKDYLLYRQIDDLKTQLSHLSERGIVIKLEQMQREIVG